MGPRRGAWMGTRGVRPNLRHATIHRWTGAAGDDQYSARRLGPVMGRKPMVSPGVARSLASAGARSSRP